MRRFGLRVLVATLMAVPLVGIGGTASATPVDLLCPSAATLNFSPGVTLGSQTVHISGNLTLGTATSPATPCSSVLAGVPYTGGTGTYSGTGTFGCLSIGLTGLTGSASGTVAITWNNGDTSTVSFTLAVAGAAPIVTATVTSGALEGSTVPVVPLPTSVTGNCVLTPITSVSFVAVTGFLQL